MLEPYIAVDARDALARILEGRVLGAYRPDLAITAEDEREVYVAAAEEIIGGLYEAGWILVRKPPMVQRDVQIEAD